MTTLNDLKEGDLVPVYVEVKQVMPSQFKAEVFSKTDQYEAWFSEDHLNPDWKAEQVSAQLHERFSELYAALRDEKLIPKEEREGSCLLLIYLAHRLGVIDDVTMEEFEFAVKAKEPLPKL